MEVVESSAATSFSGIGGECIAMEIQEYNVATSNAAIEGNSQVALEQVRKLIASESLDFDSWTSLISETESTFPDDIELISLVYESFLSKFPLCHLYWKRYADHKTRLCSIEEAVQIFELAVQLAQHSVPLWVDYCSFSMLAFEDPSDIRWLFKRGILCVGKDYLCHNLWDKFVEFEYSLQQWSSIAHLFIQTLRFPTKKLHIYYKNFKKFATLMEMEMNNNNNCNIEVTEEALTDGVIKTTEKEIYHVIQDLDHSLDISTKSKALKKYISIGELLYCQSCQLNEKIHCFEDSIRRPFFHVKPLDNDQVAKWHQYLDFIEKQDDFDWAVKLYERCLITCANYPEFWMRYVEFTESNGGRELANIALERATQVFLKDLPVIHIFNARFKEKIGDLSGARAAYHQLNAESSSYVENVIKEANMEKRLGNFMSASAVYEKALKVVAEKHMLHSVPVLYVHFSRLRYMITGTSDAAIDVIIDGIQHIPPSKLLLEELINFAMVHDGSRHFNKVDAVIANAISPGQDMTQTLGTKDREELSSLFLEFVDLWGTKDDVTKAWNRHINLFPHLIRTALYNNPILSNKPSSVVNEGTRKGPFFMLNQASAQDQGLLSLENRVMNPDQVSADQLQLNNADKSAAHQVEVRPSKDEGASEAMELAHDSIQKSKEEASEHLEASGGSPKFAKATHHEPELEEDNDLQNNLIPHSVENLSLDSPEKQPQVLVCTDSHVPQEMTPDRSPAVDSAKIPKESDENESVISPLSLEKGKLNNAKQDLGGAISGVHGNSHDPDHQQQQATLQENQYQSTSAANVNTTTIAALAVENVPTCVSHPQAQVQIQIQNAPAYNQMLQSYYQQQLMQQQYQQQLLQMQPYLQQQLLHQQYQQGQQQIQGPIDQSQQQQYMFYMQQFMQQCEQQHYQQQHYQQHYNLPGEQGYLQLQMLQQQQQQIPPSYYQQGQGIEATVTSVAGLSESVKTQHPMITQPPPTTTGAHRPSDSPHSRLQSPPPCGAAGKSKATRTPYIGHSAPRKK